MSEAVVAEAVYQVSEVYCVCQVLCYARGLLLMLGLVVCQTACIVHCKSRSPALLAESLTLAWLPYSVVVQLASTCGLRWVILAQPLALPYSVAVQLAFPGFTCCVHKAWCTG